MKQLFPERDILPAGVKGYQMIERQGQFRDTHGEVWQLCCDPQTVRRVNQRLNVDLLALGNEKIADLRSNPILVGKILVILLEDRIVLERLMTTKAFFRRLDGDVLMKASEAICWRLTIDTPCPPARREAWKKAVEQLIETARELESLGG